MADHPSNVVEALIAVRAELGAIGKEGRASAQQGGYEYRGIEQLTAALGPLFGKHGVVIVPKVLSHETRELVVNGKPWTDEVLEVTWNIYGPGGAEDKIEAGPIIGIGRDNSDKGANKAMTQAVKYLFLQMFCVGGDTDGSEANVYPDERVGRAAAGPRPRPSARETPEAPRGAPVAAQPKADPRANPLGALPEKLAARLRALPKADRDAVKAWAQRSRIDLAGPALDEATLVELEAFADTLGQDGEVRKAVEPAAVQPTVQDQPVSATGYQILVEEVERLEVEQAAWVRDQLAAKGITIGPAMTGADATEAMRLVDSAPPAWSKSA